MMEDLYLLAEMLGVQVVEVPGLHKAGRWNAKARIIQLRAGMIGADQKAVLAHELMHAYFGHEGAQSSSVEERVDEAAALLLITDTEYAEVERLYGCDPRVVADILELPEWVVVARRRVLERMRF